ncbi:hypothetical protein BSR29_01285 [Boudabousia liubingyangii]|uniref:Glycosyltransferase subfamily 4-like N-terminal domain-containing protein n=1 Tax=Boudabousia liubingyangii TaxID=1921764 RepID=A0A1Q5PQD7_9ACTO|nr:glycosyltransferase [Boudabousia liubingyangii]OKL49620.1 hypothetical protein BSR29_01285 [Boudabousia liubingyangii]
MSTETQKKLKVAQFCDNYGPGSNGLMYAVQQLEGNLLDAGHEVIVVAPAATGPNPHYGRPGRTEIRLPSILVAHMPTKVATSRRFRKTLKQLEQMQPDVLHVHGLGPVGLLGIWAAKRLQIPTILTWHTDFEAYADHYRKVLPYLIPLVHAFIAYNGGELLTREDLKQARADFANYPRNVATLLGVCRKMLETADVVTSPSPKTASRCQLICPGLDVQVIPNGVNPLPGTAEVDRGPIGKAPKLLYAGRIAPEKGIDRLLDAFELVRLSYPQAHLTVVGDWAPYPKIAKRLEAARDAGYVSIPGEFPRDELGQFYASADLFVFPSLTDTQALVLHEAALAGLPIVSVDPELQLVIKPGSNGMVTQPAPEAFAAGIMQLLQNLKSRRFAKKAAKTSRKLAGKWSIESQAQAMLDLYQELAAR